MPFQQFGRTCSRNQLGLLALPLLGECCRLLQKSLNLKDRKGPTEVASVAAAAHLTPCLPVLRSLAKSDLQLPRENMARLKQTACCAKRDTPLLPNAVANWLVAPSLQPLGRVTQSITLHIHSLDKLFKAKVHERACRSKGAVLICEGNMLCRCALSATTCATMCRNDVTSATLRKLMSHNLIKS